MEAPGYGERADDEGPAGPSKQTGEGGPGRREDVAERYSGSSSGGRVDAHPQGAIASSQLLRWEGTTQGRESRRSRGSRRGDSGRGAGGRRKKKPASGRGPAFSGRGDTVRRDDRADPPHHHNPDARDCQAPRGRR